MVHLESTRGVIDWGLMDSSHCRAFTQDLSNLVINTVPDSSLLGIVNPDNGVTFDLAQSKLAT